MKAWKVLLPLLLSATSAWAVEPKDFVGDYWAALGYDRRSWALIIDRIDSASAQAFTASGRFGVSCKGLTPVTLQGRKQGGVWRVGFDYRSDGRGEFGGVPEGRIIGEWAGPHAKGQFTLYRGGVYGSCPELKLPVAEPK